jgi:hypothetical protein
MTMPEIDNTYQGWANHATWAIHLWISNDEGLADEARRVVRETLASPCDYMRGLDDACDGGKHRKTGRTCLICDGTGKAAPFRAADALRAWVEDPDNGVVPDLGATLASDLLSHALANAEWRELAEAFSPEAA